jgi:hypothetical protein
VASCILKPEHIWPDGAPDIDGVITALRRRVFRSGICSEDFQTLLDRDDAAFQHVFGENVLVKIEFDVARFGEHSHLVHIPAAGHAPEIITAYPEDGQLRVLGPVPWGGSPHSPLRRASDQQRVGVIAVDFGEDQWRRVSILAHAIDEARLNYNFLFQNSNSLVATLAHAAATGFVDLPGGGLNIGSGNLLYDELMGGRQAPRFLIRGGTSYSGGATSPVPKGVPQSANTDG